MGFLGSAEDHLHWHLEADEERTGERRCWDDCELTLTLPLKMVLQVGLWQLMRSLVKDRLEDPLVALMVHNYSELQVQWVDHDSLRLFRLHVHCGDLRFPAFLEVTSNQKDLVGAVEHPVVEKVDDRHIFEEENVAYGIHYDLEKVLASHAQKTADLLGWNRLVEMICEMLHRNFFQRRLHCAHPYDGLLDEVMEISVYGDETRCDQIDHHDEQEIETVAAN
jgi:hypothetical protein